MGHIYETPGHQVPSFVADGDVEAKLDIVHLKREGRPQELWRRHNRDVKRGMEFFSLTPISTSQISKKNIA